MKLFETHFHVDKIESFDEYQLRAQECSVSHLLAVGADEAGSDAAQAFAQNRDNCWFAAGIHPHDAETFEKDVSLFFSPYRNDKKLVAVGEIGLDYFYERSERNKQKQLFKAFLNLALEEKLPAIIHCRDQDGKDDAYRECYDLLKEFSEAGGQFVVHCFTGTVEWCQKFLDIGAFIGITGIVTFPRADNVREVLNIVPLDRLFLETDSPYLAPVPYRGKQNCSAYLLDIATYVAQELGTSVDDIAKQTTENACRFFNV